MIGRAVIGVAAAVSLSGCMLPFVIVLTATELRYESSALGNVCDDPCVPSGPALPFSIGPQQTEAINQLRFSDAEARCKASGAGATPDCVAYLLQ
jgi:hypothetical protein